MKRHSMGTLTWGIAIAAVASAALLAGGDAGVPDLTPRADALQRPMPPRLGPAVPTHPTRHVPPRRRSS